MENYFYIVNKDGDDVLFKLKREQEIIYNDIKEAYKKGEKYRGIVLKARQLGISTFSIMLMLAMAMTTPNFCGMLITHRDDISSELFSRLLHTFDNLPNELKPSVAKRNQGELVFNTPDGRGLNSKILIRVASENGTGIGRGVTLNYLHISEYPQWKLKNKSQELGSIMSALTSKSIMINEATARGYDDFKNRFDTAMSGTIDMKAYFFPWYNEKAYRMKYNGFKLNNEEEELIKKFNLDLEQIAWRRNIIEGEYGGDVNLFHQEYPSTPEEAFLSSGDCVYDLNIVNERIRELREKGNPNVDVGYFQYRMYLDEYSRERKINEIEWVSDKKNGFITIYKEPESRKPYVLGVDPSGEGSDYSAGIVLDNITSEQVATLHKQNIDDGELKAQIYCLGEYYNHALIIPETNYSIGLTGTLKEYEAKLYISENEENSMEYKLEKKYGFRTTTRTRPLLIAMSIEFINKSVNYINDVRILNEAQNFVRVYKVTAERTIIKEQANVGSHDDLLFALMLALYGRESGQQDFMISEEENTKLKKKNVEFEMIFGKEDNNNESEGYIYYD